MMKTWRSVWFALLVGTVGAACTVKQVSSDDTGDPSSSSDASTSNATATSSTGTATATSTTATTTGSSTAATTATASSTGAGGSGDCSVGDCGMCLNGECAANVCSTEFMACAANPDCSPLNDCYIACQGDSTCLGQCDQKYPNGIADVNAVYDCLICNPAACFKDCDGASICPP